MPELKSPLRGGRLDQPDAERLAGVMKALADPTRLRMLSILAAGRSTQRQIQELVGLSQPTIAHHTRILVAAGFVVREQRSTHVWLSLSPEAISAVADAIRPERAR